MGVLHKKYAGRAVAAAGLISLTLFGTRPGWTAPLEVYGRLPSIEDVDLSPDGSRIAYVHTSQDTRTVVIYALSDHKLLGEMAAGSVKLRSLRWADNDHLLILMSATTVPRGTVGPVSEVFALKVYSTISRKATAVPDPTHLWGGTPVLNITYGNVMVRHVDGDTVLFVPGAYMMQHSLPALFRIDLQTGEESIFRKGSDTTEQWLIDEKGQVAAEEDYDARKERWALLRSRNGRMEEIASGHYAIDRPRLIGFGPTEDTFVLQTMEQGRAAAELLSSQDGTSVPQPLVQNRVLDWYSFEPFTDRLLGGVIAEGEDLPHYVFFDRNRQASWDAIVRAFGKDRVDLICYSDDFKKIVVKVTGPQFGYLYDLIDMNTHKDTPIGDIYDGITEPLEMRPITYEAADGLKIPAFVTLPRNKAPKSLPLIVLPHGGPALVQVREFDWWAQALADQGYAVLQPNYRGSDLNKEFLAKGFGEWGRKMQTDLSDGVRYLVREGIADPTRVCIVGGSYGGYAALAGVTLDPGVYRCAISVAGISDLKRMLSYHGSADSVARRYWDRFMGVTGPGDPRLDEISPIKHAEAVHVPVLLIHGRDDTVVPFEQSTRMVDALKHAHKDVQLVTLNQEDHWLSRSETRLRMLQSTVAFLRAHNPPD